MLDIKASFMRINFPALDSSWDVTNAFVENPIMEAFCSVVRVDGLAEQQTIAALGGADHPGTIAFIDI
jgi:hypothetical protein